MKFIIGLLVPLTFVFIMRSQYTFLQAEHYEIKRYLKHNSKKKIIFQSIMLFLLALGLSSYSHLFWGIFFISLTLNLTLINSYKLKYTKRVRRGFIVFYVIAYFIYCFLPFGYIKSFFVINNLILVIFLLMHFLSALIEKLILNKYVRQAKHIIKEKKVIGITGSYGKTSSKNILYDMLKFTCNVSKTPKSYNTKVGIVKSIRENTTEFDDVFICEYGVDRKGGMNKLLTVVKPNVSLVTSIGNQHLLTFKNVENIANEKIKLATILKEQEIAVINNDNIYLNKKIKDLKCKVITYGIECDSDVMAKNIVINAFGSTFDLYIKNKKIKNIKIKLLGIHNVLNTLGAIGVLMALNIDLKNINKLILNINQVEHRLQLKEMDGFKVIDDSFNSNEEGFKSAIDVLSLMKEKKIVITPGIIEQGGNSDKVNYELGAYMADKIDLAVLVGKNSNSIKEGLLSKKIDKNKIIIKNSFLDAWKYLKDNEVRKNKIILIENDLPSIYLK